LQLVFIGHDEQKKLFHAREASKKNTRKCLELDKSAELVMVQPAEGKNSDLIHYCDCCLFYYTRCWYTINLFMAEAVPRRKPNETERFSLHDPILSGAKEPRKRD
jgi:hypothetical protein